ncbi:hypothetical protein BS636_13670 [Acinetobacter sp. LoGeW2-3]|uniref:hypothetical protein n=1 Tax=Acinetobacter sp. LoGeW2-3 TaxID=1808001 RepID=UPI000C057FE5|nr:hypothetical protein [Acinetobacter sp. LoGeW2-3]ATO20648.1 hypothetical protein BS636_13670 [Acinetobacter sp. LoGeW2-3]
MNVKPNPFNSAKVFLASSALTLAALALIAKPEATEYKPSYGNSQPSDYGVQTLQVNGETGVAVVKLDGFRVQVSFDFEAHPDSYGVPGSDFTAVEITNLAVDKITDANGNPYNDFTDHNDHRNINLLLSTFIEKNNLVEV